MDMSSYGSALKIIALLIFSFIIFTNKEKNKQYLIAFFAVYALASFMVSIHLKYIESKVVGNQDIKLDSGIYESYANILICAIVIAYICCYMH